MRNSGSEDMKIADRGREEEEKEEEEEEEANMLGVWRCSEDMKEKEEGGRRRKEYKQHIHIPGYYIYFQNDLIMGLSQFRAGNLEQDTVQYI